MRVLALVTDAFGGYGGIAQYNRDFLFALSRSSHVREVVVLPRTASGSSFELPHKINQLAPYQSKTTYTLSAFRAAAFLGTFDLIFCGHLNMTPLAALLARTLRVPFWLQAHGIDAWGCPTRAIRFATERSALITAVSRYTKRRMLEWSNLEPTLIRVLPNTIRAIFSPGPVSLAVLEKYRLQERKIILTVSRINRADHYKGHAEVIKALPQILTLHPDIVYVVAGDGDGRADLESLVSKLQLQSHVRFLGRVSDEDIVELYRSSSVFIMPSSKEGFGIVFSEAAATGLHVIGGNRDGSADALAEGRIGRMIDPRSKSNLIAAICDALNGEYKGANPGEVQRFSFPNFARHVDGLVQNFIR